MLSPKRLTGVAPLGAGRGSGDAAGVAAGRRSGGRRAMGRGWAPAGSRRPGAGGSRRASAPGRSPRRRSPRCRRGRGPARSGRCRARSAGRRMHPRGRRQRDARAGAVGPGVRESLITGHRRSVPHTRACGKAIARTRRRPGAGGGGGIMRGPRARSSVDQSIGLRNRVVGGSNPLRARHPLFDLAGNSRARVTVEMSRPSATVGACHARPSTRPWCGRPVRDTLRVASAWTASSAAAGATPTGGPAIGA